MSNELRRILGIEDEADIQDVIRFSLAEIGGFDVQVCDSGLDALARATFFAPDLVLLDVMMPQMNGPVTFEAIRRLPGLASTPIVFLTANVEAHKLKELRAMGATDVLMKPFDALALPGRLRSIWLRHHEVT